MTALLVAADDGLWHWRRGGLPRRVARLHDASWVHALPGGFVVALSGSARGSVHLLRCGADGLLDQVDVQDTGGSEPCHAALSHDGRTLVVANYADAVLCVVELRRDRLVVHPHTVDGGGSMAVPDRQAGPHPHHVLFLDRTSLVVTDLGSDLIRFYTPHAADLVPTGTCAVPRGSGPRHLVVIDGIVLVSAELSGQVLAARLADVRGGSAVWRGTTTTGPAFTPALSGEGPVSYPGDLVAGADGTVYCANRGADSVAHLRIELDTGVPVPICVAETPVASWPHHVRWHAGDLVVATRDDGLWVGAEHIAVPRPKWTTVAES